ncbi:IS66 family transposase [Sulfobacillus harzensis]|uniref:IS66 family transposase n=1 Tax=Sulfobacillus harzensis TaxID=2729629 RepID=A0A7Y0L480_9FIRM|nr:IS66 family transposase [Sulfobacillus harzensis]NMP21579.1 IS66 family transposase [Sulfobacillus harzensis]
MTNRTQTAHESHHPACRCDQLEHEVAQLRTYVQQLEEQIRLSQHRRFGASSERADAEQLRLFNEAEVAAVSALDAGPVDTETHPRPKKRPGQREAAWDHLPVERIEYRLPPEEQVCPTCAQALHEMSTEVRRELHIVPAQVTVREHVQYVYACRSCERDALTTPVVTAPMPRSVHPGSFASPSVLGHILHQKYTLGLPLYRQEQEWRRLGVPISRQTMANWVVYAAHEWLHPLYHELRRHLLLQDILQADETTVQVLHEDGRAPEAKSYMWLYRTGREGPAIVLYDYQKTRAGSHPKAFLAGFEGYLQVDGYAGYHDVEKVTLIGCFAHARRKFDEALKALPAGQRAGPSTARTGLDFCNRLYAVEHDLRESSPEDRFRARRARSAPILSAFHTWLQSEQPQVLPQSAVGKAVTYCLNQWAQLAGYLLDGRLEIDNNRSERAIKPFVIGRSNWLFSNTPRGAKASALVYSIIETAKENGLNPQAYLQYLFEELPNRDLKDAATWTALLPWSSQLPEDLKSPAPTRQSK